MLKHGFVVLELLKLGHLVLVALQSTLWSASQLVSQLLDDDLGLLQLTHLRFVVSRDVGLEVGVASLAIHINLVKLLLKLTVLLWSDPLNVIE